MRGDNIWFNVDLVLLTNKNINIRKILKGHNSAKKKEVVLWFFFCSHY